MTERVAESPKPDGSLLLRELDHRIKNELTSAICAVSAKAAQSESAVAKAALLDVVDFLHQWADVHRSLYMPDQGRLTDAASYVQQLCKSVTKYRLDILAIRVLFSADDLQLEGERCWRLGVIVSELLTNVARHAQFDGRHPELKVKLILTGSVVNCRISDNGSAPEVVRHGRGLTLIDELASSLNGRILTTWAAKGSSSLLTFPLTEAEHRVAADAIHIDELKRSKKRRSLRLQVSKNEDLGAG